MSDVTERPVTPAAVVFDFDGLVLDTESAVFASWGEVFRAHGAEPLSVEEWAVQVGTADALDPVEVLEERAGAVDDALLEARQAHRDRLVAREPVRPGVEEWLDAAEAAGLGVAIASSSEPEWVLGHLERLGLRDRFGPVVCRGPGLPPKPAPDLYLAACRALRVAPTDSIALEDSPHGVRAARRAGLFCVAVPNLLTRAYDLSEADVVVDSLAALPLEEALALAGAAGSRPETRELRR